MRSVDEHNQAILNKLKETISKEYGTIESNKNILKIENIRYGQIPSPDDYAKQKSTLDQKKTFGVEYFALCKLIDKATNKILDQGEINLGIIPTSTNRHSFIINGREYIVHNQTRLRSGIYTKFDRNENPVVDFNLEKGKNFSLILLPAKQEIQVEIGSSHINLYTFAHDIFNIELSELKNILGDTLHSANLQKYQQNREKDIEKLFEKLNPQTEESIKQDSIKDQIKYIQNYYENTKMDSDVNKMTINKPISNVNKEAVLIAIKKLINVYSEKEEPTWKDNLAFKKIMGTEDFLEEKFVKRARLLHAKIRPKLQTAKKLTDLNLKYYFNSLLDEFFVESDLVNYPMQINPMEMIENAYKLTPLGEGGINSTDSLPLDARNLHTSFLGYIDPVRTPDNIRAGIDNRATLISKKEGQTIKTLCIDKNGKLVYKTPQELFNIVYALEKEKPDNMGLYTCFYQGKLLKKKKEDIELFIKSDLMFTPTTLQIPFIEATHPQRAAMGAKMTTQAVSLVNREEPLVTTNGADFVNQNILIPKAKVSGTVTKIDKDKIIIKDALGKEHEHNIPHNFPLNYTSFLHATPKVKVGDKVKQGDILAEHNFSKNGKLALGINLDVAFVPYKGLTFEDAIVVTESGAKKLSSEHMYNEELDLSGGLETKKDKYVSYYPNKFNINQLNNLDADGVVKKGTKLHNGDPIILALRKKRESPEVLAVSKMSSRISNPYNDEAIIWNKDYPGEVIDVVKTGSHIKVSIKATAPLVVGDKLCFDLHTEVKTINGWKKISEITLKDKILTLSPAGPIYQKPKEIFKYQSGGRMYFRKSPLVDILVTENHCVFGEFNAEELLDNFPMRVKVSEIFKKKFIFIKLLEEDTKELFPELEYEWFLDDPKDATEGYIDDYKQPVIGISMPHENLYVRRNNKERFCGNSNRFGNKGVVSAIIPDSEAPKRPDGSVPDLIMNPAGLPSRKNISQVFETVAAKVVKQKGLGQIKHEAFSTDNLHEELDKLKNKHGVKDTETLYDPINKTHIPDVMVGTQYIYKLHKQAETSFSARAGGKYDIDLRPIKGGEEGAKSIGILELYGFLAHNQGSRSLLREAATYKAEYNPEVWKSILTGKQPPPPKPTFAFEKFLTMLKGAGINVKRENSEFKLAPLTDKEVLSMSNGEIHEPKVVFGKPDPETGLPFRPEPNGLFDPKVTGGLIGKNWGHITLPTTLPNPAFEKPIRILLDLTQTELNDIIQHKLKKTVDGKELTGGELIKALLSKINVNQEIKKQQDLLEQTKSIQKRDVIYKKLKYLTALSEMNLRPEEAYTMKTVPVIPPAFRPIYPQQDGSVVTSDANYLYRDVLHAKNMLNSPIIKALGSDSPEHGKAVTTLYDSIKKLQGLNKSETQKANEREPVGFLRTIIGNQQVKHGYFQSKLLSRVQDIVARGVIAVDPSLKMDEIGLPEPMAWQLFGPFVIGQLVKNGYSPDKAAEEVEKRTQAAKNVLLAEMKERPVIAKRDPVLHKFGVLAFMPKLIQGIHIKISPLVTKGFGADFDGDTFTIHIPLTLDSIMEAKTMFPSKHLNNPLDRTPMHVPNQDAILGLYLLSKPRQQTPVATFKTKEEAMQAFKEGKIKINDKIRIQNFI